MASISYYFIVGFVLLILIYAFCKKTNVYDAFISGCFDSMKVGISILPYLLCMYVAVSVFKASGILNDLIKVRQIPSELFIQGFFRPASSHASLSMMLSIFSTYGPDSAVGMVSSILQGGSDTTIYVMGLYFGSIGIKKTRHAYAVGLVCDLVCFLCCIGLLLLFF